MSPGGGSVKASWKKKLKVESTDRSRDRLKKKVEEKKKNSGLRSWLVAPDEKEKTQERRSKSPQKLVKDKTESKKSIARTPKQPEAAKEVVSTMKRKRLSSDDKPGPSRGRSVSVMKRKKVDEEKKDEEEKEKIGSNKMKRMKEEEVKAVVVEGGEVIVKKRRGRPVGWKPGQSYITGQPKASILKSSVRPSLKKKLVKDIVKKIKKKYTREVTPCPEEETKGVGTRKKAAKISPMKTRTLQKKIEKEEKSLVPRCVLCKSKNGDLFKCAECTAHYHLRKCCRYSETTAGFIERGDRKRWLCARCISCTHCNEYINDPHNVECSICALAFHGKCAAKGGNMVEEWTFVCHKCTKIDAGMRHHVKKEKKKEMEEIVKVEKVVPSKGGRKRHAKGWQYIGKSAEGEEDKRMIEERDELYDSLVHQITGSKNGSGPSSNHNSPSKFGVLWTSPMKPKKVALDGDKSLFEEAKRAWNEEKTKKTKSLAADSGVPSTSRSGEKDDAHKWIYVGSKKNKMKSVYSSPYPPEIFESQNLYICPFCLRAVNDTDMYRIHQLECTWNCPPGNEIYRDTDKKISFFEIDGAIQKQYCRRVCLLGKLFISSKTLVDEVETFLFYVLVEHTNEGAEFVGYFSKEKNPSKNNNLSCILTLPSAMRSGYGRLLIDLSYELSRIEKKIGSPEHPLSDLGLLAYKGFWRSSILCYLRSLRGTNMASVKQISLATRISPQDVINQLLRDSLLFYKDGVYFVNTEQRAYRMPLASSRRKTIDHSKIKWKPDNPNFDFLDSTKINYYV